MGQPAPKLYLVHAGRMSMAPAELAFASEWPEARPHHILDDSIHSDGAKHGATSPMMLRRFELIGEYCAAAEAGGVLFTCSAFSEAIGRVKRAQRFPVLTPYEAMFERVLAASGRTVILYTFEGSEASLRRELAALAREKGSAGSVEFQYLPDAFDRPDHDAKVVEACSQLAKSCSAIAMAQFSMATATQAAQQASAVPIWDTPRSAVRKLRELCGA